jgi:TldD protein
MLQRLVAHLGEFDAYGELRWQANRSWKLVFRKGILLDNSYVQNSGTSARTYANGCFGFAASAHSDDSTISDVIAEAKHNTTFFRNNLRAASDALPVSGVGHGCFDYRSTRPTFSVAERVRLLARLDEIILSKYPALLNVDLFLSTHASEKALVTTEGAKTYSYVPRSDLIVKMSVEANDGVVELHDVMGGFGEFEDQAFHQQQLLDWLDNLYEYLRLKAEGEQCCAGVHDVILDSALAGILAHEAIGHTCEADLVLGGSVAADNLGRVVASEKITVCDFAGRGPDEKSSLAIHVDDEGTACRDVTIIENGVLKNFMHSKLTAKLMGAVPTGNARAYSFSDEPLVRMRNTAILPGKDKISDMIRAIDRGYFLKRATNGQADATSEFMFGVNCGFEIRNGKIGSAIRDTTISGVAFDVLKTVTHVGDEFTWSGAGGWCGKKQIIAVDMGGPAIKCRVIVGGTR